MQKEANLRRSWWTLRRSRDVRAAACLFTRCLSTPDFAFPRRMLPCGSAQERGRGRCDDWRPLQLCRAAARHEKAAASSWLAWPADFATGAVASRDR